MSCTDHRARLGLAAIAVLLLAAGTASGQATWSGVFSNPAQSEGAIDAAIDAAVSHFNLAVRPIARSRLKKVNATLKRVEIARRGEEITVTLGSNTPSTTAPGRPPVKWTRDDGEVVDVSLEWRDAALLQTVAAGESRRVNRFELSPDGATLTLQVTVTGPQLQPPLQYQLVFRRDAAK
jgi:hypothetical protein